MTHLLTLPELSRELKIPRSWLQEQTKAQRLPCLRIGRRILYDRQAVEDTLIAWARVGAPPSHGSATHYVKIQNDLMDGGEAKNDQ